MATELQVFLLLRVTVNAPLIQAITNTGTSTGTCINVNVA